jgi:hypothetical protein
MQLENQRLIADANNQTQLMIAEMAANQKAQLASQQQAHELQLAQLQGSQATQQQDSKFKHEQATAEAPTAAAYEAVESKFVPVMREMIENLSKPRRIVRDENGKMVGLQ